MNHNTHIHGLLGAWRRLDRHLLLNQPRLWAMRFHSALALGLLATVASLIIATLIPVQVDDIPNVRPFFLSLIALTALASLYWVWLQFRVLRHVSVRGRDGGGATFLLNLLCLAAINLPPLAATELLRARIIEVVPEQQYLKDERAFSEGLKDAAAYNDNRGTYSCLAEGEGFTPRWCETTTSAPLDLLGSECTAWAHRDRYRDQIDCHHCEFADEDIEQLVPLIERYGCARAPTNFANLTLVHAPIAVETAPSRRHVFLVWFLSVIAATVLTLVRTTCARWILEAATVMVGVWVALTFLNSAFDTHQGVSSLLPLGLCVLAVPIAALALLRPDGVTVRLLLAACLLAPSATIIAGMVVLTPRELFDRTEFVESLTQFSTDWSTIGATTFYGLIGLATAVVFAMLALYRPVGQRMAAGPRPR